MLSRIYAVGASANKPQRLGAAEPQPKGERPLNRRDAMSAEKTAREKILLEMRDSGLLHCDGRREKSKEEGAQSDHHSVTCLQVAETGLPLHCNSPSCSQAARNPYANAEDRQNHGRTESYLEDSHGPADCGQSAMILVLLRMILSRHDSVGLPFGCGFAALCPLHCNSGNCSQAATKSCGSHVPVHPFQ